MLERLSECYVDALRLAKTGQQLKGELDVASLSRLALALANTNGKAAVTLQFGIDAQGISFIRGNVRWLPRRCWDPGCHPGRYR